MNFIKKLFAKYCTKTQNYLDYLQEEEDSNNKISISYPITLGRMKQKTKPNVFD